MARKKKISYTYAVGKRKESNARVHLFKGSGESVVNGIPYSKFFPGNVFETLWKKPFKVTETLGKYFVTVKVAGGGKRGQLDASIQGIAKALASFDKDKYRSLLKKEGLLTRDSRIRERRKVGTGGKARRKKQSPKR